MPHKKTIQVISEIKINKHNECHFCEGFHEYKDYGICGEQIPDPTDPNHPFSCTRPAGHSGIHMACSPNIKNAGILSHNLNSVLIA